MPERVEIPWRSDVAAQIARAAVQLINQRGVERTTASAICRVADVDEATFAGCFGSANDVFIEIARSMTAAFGTAISATMHPEHSLYDSVRAAHNSFLDVVHDHVETEEALMAIRAAAATDPGIGVPEGSASTLHAELMVNAELWLGVTARHQRVRWDLPGPLLAHYVSARLTGVVIDYLAHRDLAASRALVDLIAADLARHGHPLP
jgi:AcrR family transcriptional regulator